MNDQARETLNEIIAMYGRTVCRTPRSCELVLTQALSGYPEEARVLSEALRTGVVGELLAPPPGPAWPELAGRLEAQAGLSADEARWAVESWGEALGRSAPAAAPLTPSFLGLDAPSPEASDVKVVVATTTIVAGGGGLGGALGAGMFIGAMTLTHAALKLPFAIDRLGISESRGRTVMTVVCTIIMLAGFFGGALGAAFGWMYGKGTRAPWTGFSAAFFAAFGSAAIFGYLFGLLGDFFGAFIAAFSAAARVAHRGGHVS
jgi:hypothetical protein